MSFKNLVFSSSLAILANTVLTQTTTNNVATATSTLFAPGFGAPGSSMIGSLVTATPGKENIYELSCLPDNKGFECAIAPYTFTEGISRFEMGWGAKSSGSLTFPAGHVSCTVTSDAATCLATQTGETLTTTVTNAKTEMITALITSAAAASSTNVGAPQPQPTQGGNGSTPVVPTPTPSQTGGAGSRTVGAALISGVLLFAIVAVL